MTTHSIQVYTRPVTRTIERKPFSIRFSEQEREMLESLAEERGVTPPVFLRLVVRDLHKAQEAEKKKNST